MNLYLAGKEAFSWFSDPLIYSGIEPQTSQINWEKNIARGEKENYPKSIKNYF